MPGVSVTATDGFRVAMTAPLEVSVELDCPAGHAFATWTESFALWWPHSHTVTATPDTVVLEPRLGGRIFERAADGTEHQWGARPPNGNRRLGFATSGTSEPTGPTRSIGRAGRRTRGCDKLNA